jgi:hypothetical protein
MERVCDNIWGFMSTINQFICYWEVSTDSDTCYNKELWDKHRIQNKTKTYQNIVWLTFRNHFFAKVTVLIENIFFRSKLWVFP